MEITIKMIAPKASNCGHITVEYLVDKQTIKKVYHKDDLSTASLADFEPALKQVVGDIVAQGLKADPLAKLSDLCITKTVEI
jgi:hypothetical protein